MYWQKCTKNECKQDIIYFLLTLPGPGGRGAKLAPPPTLVLITFCTLKNADMNSKLLDNFIDMNQEIFSIDKRKK